MTHRRSPIPHICPAPGVNSQSWVFGQMPPTLTLVVLKARTGSHQFTVNTDFTSLRLEDLDLDVQGEHHE